ncbi:MAG: hypothetical protein K8T91_04425 [Planctomycetes bacterium]|nr:hypothetical protein [Planctomycetota bacterium]
MNVRHWSVSIAVLLSIIFLGGAALLVNGCSNPEPIPPVGAGNNSGAPSDPKSPTKPDPQQIRKEALELQRDAKWCDALAKWQELQKYFGNPPDLQLRAEAEVNQKLADSRCKPPRELTDSFSVPPLTDRPEAVPEPQFKDFYTPGRTIRSVAYLNIKGEGSNTRWIFKQDSQFAYRYRVVAETKVTANKDNRITFEQHFPEIVQLLAVSEEKLELHEPDAPILGMVWEQLEKNVLNSVPIYVWLRRAGDIATSGDPKLQGTLTTFWQALRNRGKIPNANADVQFIAELDQFTGARLQFEYANGSGVTHIKVLQGPKYDPDDLQRIAYGSSLLADYFVSQAADKNVGDTARLRARDVSGMFSFGYDCEIDPKSHLDVKRAADTQFAGQPVRALEVTGGDVSVQARLAGSRRTARFVPLSGTIEYSPSQLLVQRAKLKWEGNADHVSENHLLFGTENVTNVAVDSYYEAEVVK